MRTLSRGRLLVAGAGAAVVAALIAGMLAVGPPSLERERKLDEIRVADLAAIENLITSFAKFHKGLPPDLTSLALEPGYSISRTDPQSGKAYEYEMMSTDTYRLCAYFARHSTREGPSIIYFPGNNNTWSHGAGHQCFNRRVDFALAGNP